jgi:glycosyl transferase family 25
MFEFVDHVVYINLSNRTDRRMSIETELSQYFSVSKISRFDAIRDEKGIVGCGKSHAGAVRLAIQRGWKNCLIVEDDAAWSNFEKGYPLLEKLVQQPYDVIGLGTTFTRYNPETYKLYCCCAATGCLISGHYYQTYLDNLEEGLEKLIETGITQRYANDVYWRKLQAKDNWYCIMPALMVQKEGYSDIEKKNVNYDQYFNTKLMCKI